MTSRTDSLLHRYMQELGPIRLLTREQEVLLWQRWQTEGDWRARDQLVRASLHLVVRIAARYRGYRVPRLELICEGNFGIVRALQRFDVGRGYRFVTYAAYWIRAEMLNFIIRSHSLVSTESGPLRAKTFFRLRRERARICALMGEDDAAHEALASRLELSSKQLREFEHRLFNRDASIYAEPHCGRGVPLVDVLACPSDDQEETYMVREHHANLSRVLRAALERLDKRERYVLASALMCDDEDALSLAEIGRRLGVSRERTRQLEVRALKKLRTQVLCKFSPAELECHAE